MYTPQFIKLLMSHPELVPGAKLSLNIDVETSSGRQT
jgi:hypothetical protein